MITFVPLILSYGRTIHSAQGLSIGPSKEGQAINMLLRCIVHLGTLKFLASHPGLMYTAFSRATTMGDADDLLSSAIYFVGDVMSETLLKEMNTKKRTQGETLKKRDAWVVYLESNVKELTAEEKEDISNVVEWFETERYGKDKVFSLLND